MGNKITVKDIQKHTGLKYQYIMKAIKELDNVLEPYMSYGVNNSKVFESSAYQIFNQIKQFKEDGLTIRAMQDRFNDIMPINDKNPIKTNVETHRDEYKNEAQKVWIESLNTAYKEALNAKNESIENLKETIKSKDYAIRELENKIQLLLPPGKSGMSLSEIRAEQEREEKKEQELRKEKENATKELEKQKRISELQDELFFWQGKSIFSIGKKKKIQEIKQEIQKLKEQDLLLTA